MPKRLVVGITGASGVIYGIRALQMLRAAEVETHLVLSLAGRMTIAQETDWKTGEVEALASVHHDHRDVGASIASGSFVTQGMLIAPCSIKTLSAVANAYSNDLMSRAADVCLKEGRPLLLMVRETPLHKGHLKLMLAAADAGAIISSRPSVLRAAAEPGRHGERHGGPGPGAVGHRKHRLLRMDRDGAALAAMCRWHD